MSAERAGISIDAAKMLYMDKKKSCKLPVHVRAHHCFHPLLAKR